MLGKTAGGLFWMFRYLERAENNARLLDAGFRIALTRSSTAEAEWKSILTTAGSIDQYDAQNDGYESMNVVDFMLRDPGNPSSVISTMKQARDNARLVRTALTREVWESTNESWMTLKKLLSAPILEQDLPDVLATIRQQSAQVRGATLGTLLRDDGYNFIRLGTFVERADYTARILDVKYYLLLPSIAQIGSALDVMQWETILRSVSAQRAYRWLNGAEISPLNIAEFLILHQQMPRSLIFCSQKISDNLGYLERGYGVSNESCGKAKASIERLQNCTIDQIFDQGLHEFIEDFTTQNGELAVQIEQDYRFQG
ncbi:alpha-E domain-containing protein [Parasphingorhabdus halotolerans]|uniref:Alpha-E domain-containing protein n=1 Tax=Parasphingorhabdus halotolerans TaxID=2725558 RepID=A0A6H2DL06_9SPHN|nr:alpha-E domain-containing protein [Parasphingorhabdus halotolerans]QJB69352.1 alpha-E domain-containing protein [Parasphingorhabdus halotolerans]